MSTYSATEQDRNLYIQQGWVCLRNIVGKKQITELRAEAQRIWRQPLDQSRIQHRRNIDGHIIADRVDPVADLSRRFRQLAQSATIQKTAHAFLGDRARLFKMKLISKWAGSGGYGLHQDFPYWSLAIPPEDILTIVVALTEFTVENGATEFIPIYKNPLLKTLPGSIDLAEDNINGHIQICNSGDLILFQSMTAHRSGPNLSSRTREAIFITFAKEKHGNLSKRYYHERDPEWMSPK